MTGDQAIVWGAATCGPPASLRAALAREPLVPGALYRARYPTDLIDIRGEVARAVSERGMATEPLPFESLHRRVRPEHRLAMPLMTGTPTIQGAPGLRGAYHRLVKYLAREVLQFDVVFEANPPLRIHFPVPMPDRLRSREGILLTHHTDTLFGEPFEQINCWLPLTSCRATNALQYAPFEQSQKLLLRFAAGLGFDAAKFAQGRELFYEALYADQARQDELLQSSVALEVDYGEVAMFDVRLVHATAENVEDSTRVSIDFRLLSLDAYEALVRGGTLDDHAPSHRLHELRKGVFYDERRAYEL